MSNPQLDISYKDTVSVWVNRPVKTKLVAAGSDLRDLRADARFY